MVWFQPPFVRWVRVHICNIACRTPGMTAWRGTRARRGTGGTAKTLRPALRHSRHSNFSLIMGCLCQTTEVLYRDRSLGTSRRACAHVACQPFIPLSRAGILYKHIPTYALYVTGICVCVRLHMYRNVYKHICSHIWLYLCVCPCVL